MIPKLKPRSFSAALAIGLFLITVVAFLRPPLLPDIGRDLGLSAMGLGALGSVFALGRLAVDLPAGRLTDRFAAGPMMAWAGILVALGSAFLALAPTAFVALVAVLVLGAGSAWTLTTAQAHFARAPRANRGVSMSIFAGALLVGQAMGPGVGGVIGAAFDWRVALASGAVLALVVAGVFLGIRTVETVEGSSASIELRPEKDIPRAVLWTIYLLPAVQFAVGAAMIQTIVPIVADADLGMGPAIVGGALVVAGLARLLSALIAGRVTDRVGRRAALLPGLGLQVLGLAVFALGEGALWWWVAILLVSLGSVSVNVGTTMLADLSEGGGLGRRLGAFRFTGDVAFVVAPTLAGWLFDQRGRTAAIVPLLVFTVAVTIAATVVLPETRNA
ncbi:MAG: MFS transporter [Acidimicrobiia bacterium]